MTKPIRLHPLSHATAGFLARVSDTCIDPTIPTCAVAVVQGKVTFFAGLAYTKIPDYGTSPARDIRQAEADYHREQLIRHEAHHILLSHAERQQHREHERWNLVCDAAIHHSTSIDLDSLRQSIGGDVAEFDKLGIPPLPPEVAYDVLTKQDKAGQRPDDGTEGKEGESIWHTCGRPSNDALREQHPNTPRTKSGKAKPETALEREERKALQRGLQSAIVDGLVKDRERGDESIEAGIGALPSDGAGTDPGGCGYRNLTGKRPSWIEDVMVQLESVGPRNQRAKSYRREHRQHVEFLPGRAKTRGTVATILVDASGSMRQKDLEQLLGALADSRFADSDVFVFDTVAVGPKPAWDAVGVKDLIGQCGGGTDLHAAWEQVTTLGVDFENPRVWFTDGQDGHNVLPTDRPNDIWIYCPWSGPIKVCSRQIMNKRTNRKEDS